jgi:Fe-S-cluster-containing hydrogenase component 2
MFLFMVLVIGVKFHGFVAYLADPSAAVAPRPAGVEAFLPISSMMGLVHWFKTGVANRVHPAGLVLFVLIVATALVARRGFCSWICPIGAISEFLHKAGKRVLGANLDVPKWLDYPAKGIKYILLGFFLYFILPMPGSALEAFINAPYNRLADVKMYLFFANISRTALFVIAALVLLSVFIKNFWCRYLCPYGALLGLASLASPVAVRREKSACRECGACARACPQAIAVDKKSRVNSPECMACYSCMDACPAPGALRMETAPGRRAVSAGLYAALIAAAFLITPVLAHALGYWNSDMSAQDFKQLYAIIENIQHPRTGGVNPGAMPAAAMGGHAGAIPHSVMPPSVDSAMQLPPGARPDLCPGMNPDSPLAEDLKEARRRLEQKNTDESDKAPVSNNPL